MSENIIEQITQIVCAYVSNNSVQMSDISALIADVRTALGAAGGNGLIPKEAHQELKPAVPVKKSVTPDFIICLEDGKKFKSLKRHLRSEYDMSPEEYREKWGLPRDYPMVAPAYSESRSKLAKQMGLGNRSEQPKPKRRAG